MQFVLFLLSGHCANHRVHTEIVLSQDLAIGSEVDMALVVYKLEYILTSSLIIIAEEGFVLCVDDRVQACQLITAGG